MEKEKNKVINDEDFEAVESNLHAEQIHKSSKWRKRITSLCH